jgi:hypothetical protein
MVQNFRGLQTQTSFQSVAHPEHPNELYAHVFTHIKTCALSTARSRSVT